MNSPKPFDSDLTAVTYRLHLEPVPAGTPRSLWSVMIPTYNCAKYLRETLASVLAQDPGPEQMQIEVVDDCSNKDDPEAVVRELAGNRVRFFRQPRNVGHTRNFETCLQRSRGHLIHLLHGDDAVRPGFYARMGAIFAEHPEIGAAFSRNLCMDENGNWTDVSPLLVSKSGVISNLVELLAVEQRIQTPAMTVRREVYETLGAFDRRLSWTEDWEMWARIATKYPVWHEVEALALYRMHANSNTGKFNRTGENIRDLGRLFPILETYVPNGRRKSLVQQGREKYAVWAMQAAAAMVATGDISAAAAQAREALRLCPTPRVVRWVLRLACGAGLLAVRKLVSKKR